MEIATLGNGCFWCTEAIFQRLEGVEKVVSGYAGGKVEKPSYDQVCSGNTGHAEVLQITYDPEKISYKEILDVFWATHDPTTLNRQGNDVGTQYRSIIFHHNEEQKAIAERSKKEMDESGVFNDPIVTFIEPLPVFYPAENYHQNYFNRNDQQPYCNFLIRPKVAKFGKAFKDKIKPEYSGK